MVIGNPISLGGGSGLSPNAAVIHATAPVGSTITFSKSGVIAKVLDASKSHVNAEDTSFADWYYAVSSANFGDWTVTATLGTYTKSASVSLSANQQYDIKLIYRLYLYNNGDMMTNITGGYSAVSDGTFANSDTRMSMLAGVDSQRFAASMLAVNLSNYTQLVASGYSPANTTSPGRYVFGIGTARNATTYAAQLPVKVQSPETVTIDISSLDSDYYIIFSNGSSSNASYIYYIYAE